MAAGPEGPFFLRWNCWRAGGGGWVDMVANTVQQMIEGRKQAPAQLGRVAVLGLGKSGRAVAEYLVPLLGGRLEQLTVYAGPSNADAQAWAEGVRRAGAQVLFDTEEVAGPFELCIASPGISQFSPFYQAAKRASGEVVSEVEFAWRESRSDAVWVAVTGTNGKTTTTALACHLLQQTGLAACAVGNIGDTCIQAVASGRYSHYVAEVSSYQLASTVNFAPNAAVVLNITPDHLAWHRSHEAYAEAKWKLLANLPSVEGAVAVIGAVNDETRTKVRQLKAEGSARGFSYMPIGAKGGLGQDMRKACGSENAAFLDGDVLTVALDGAEHALIPRNRLQLEGIHNCENALAAATAALAVGVSAQSVAAGLATFTALAHRIEPAGTVAGVACFNDSKATNVDATLAAIGAFDPKRPVILLGGRDKGTDLEPLVRACNSHAKAVVCFGEARERFLEAFRAQGAAQLQVLEAPGMETALDAGLSAAVLGDVLVLSPACASFDEFSCFEERGDVFKALVAQRAAARGE